MIRVYKRKCFQGRGAIARWLDRAFFAALAGAILYILGGDRLPCTFLSLAALLLMVLVDQRRWTGFQQRIWREAEEQVRREEWLKAEAERIRQGGGTIVFPMPDRDRLLGLCLEHGPGAAFHCFGEPQEQLTQEALALGCTVDFHPWGQGEKPDREQVEERLKQEALKRSRGPFVALLRLPVNRYLLTGTLLLLLSIFLRRALYWRLLGSLCLLIGAFRRSMRQGTGNIKEPPKRLLEGG